MKILHTSDWHIVQLFHKYNQTKDTLIGKGFGSLGLVTLNIAMDALEYIHNQGRKVGVISHVQEMMERTGAY